MIPVLLLAAVCAHLAPTLIAQTFGHPLVAWEAVLYGAEAVALYLALDRVLRIPAVADAIGPDVASGWALCTYGAFESMQRPACRLMHPMGERLVLPQGQTVCGAAGIDTADWSIAAACLAAIVVSHRSMQ